MQMDSLTCNALAEAGTPCGSTECLSIGRVCVTRSNLETNHGDVSRTGIDSKTLVASVESDSTRPDWSSTKALVKRNSRITRGERSWMFINEFEVRSWMTSCQALFPFSLFLLHIHTEMMGIYNFTLTGHWTFYLQ
jgi:hypothetical protein